MKRLNLIIILLIISASTQAQQIQNKREKQNTYTKFRFGGYGEILYQHMDYGSDRYNYPDGSQPDNRSIVDIPRFILSIDYKFRSDIELSAEIEFEHGGTGSALELEYEEMGEYEMEMEKAGEVVLEQFHITKTFSRAFKLRVGHMIVPLGMTNTRHLPIEYFGTVRPEGESTILPLTWHETGIAVLGSIKKWSYQLQLINGLDANGFSSANWIRSGKQSIFESTKTTNAAFVGRIENRSIRGLNIGAAIYHGNSTGNTAKPEKMEHIKGAVTVSSLDAEFNNGKWIARSNFIYGNVGDSYEITRINKSISKNIQYPRTPVAQNAMTYSLEAGYDLFNLFNKQSTEKLFAFGRYEHYNSMQNANDGILADARHNRDVFTVGLNYYILPNMAIKADYASRQIDGGNFNTENTFGLSLVYAGWFVSK